MSRAEVPAENLRFTRDVRKFTPELRVLRGPSGNLRQNVNGLTRFTAKRIKFYKAISMNTDEKHRNLQSSFNEHCRKHRILQSDFNEYCQK